MNFFSKFFSEKSKETENDIRVVYHNMLLIVLAITLVFLSGFYFYFQSDGLFGLLTVLAVLSAFYLAGSAIGFIFAIPKSAQGKKMMVVPASTDKNQVKPAQKESLYADNTNLEEISDWLTKIIVGLSLTQFSMFAEKLNYAAQKIGTTLNKGHAGNSSHDYYVFSFALTVFYFISGLIIGYMWTRIDFPKILTQSAKDINKIQALEWENTTLQEQRDLIVDAISNKDSAINLPEVSLSQEIENPAILEIVEAILLNRKVVDETDPQKKRWGERNVTGNRQLTAQVTPSSVPLLYKIHISVKSDPGDPFKTPVAILLHDSYNPTIRLLDATDKTEASIDVVGYEAFTVGALTDIIDESNFNSMELDLNELQGLPSGFYWGKSKKAI